MTTRDKIMTQALDLFSRKGYEPVSVRDIARAVGIKESSIYNHFQNKRAIFDSILAEYSNRWDSFFSGMVFAGEDGRFTVDERARAFYRGMTGEQFASLALAVFEQYMTDEVNVKLRRMLTIEQYGSAEVAALFRKISFEDSLDYQAQLFGALMEEGLFAQGDPAMMALAFFSPIFLIFYKYDGNEEGLAKARELFLMHIKHFSQTYGTKAPKKGEHA